MDDLLADLDLLDDGDIDDFLEELDIDQLLQESNRKGKSTMNYSDAVAGAEATLNAGESIAKEAELREYTARSFTYFRGKADGLGLRPEKAAEAFAASGIQPARFPDEKAIFARVKEMAADSANGFFDRTKMNRNAWDGDDGSDDADIIADDDVRWQSAKWQMENQDKIQRSAKAKIARTKRRGY